MSIKTFAEQHRLKIKRDAYDNPVVLGRLGRSHFYDGFENRIGLCFVPTKDDKPSTSERPRLWNSAREKCLAAGMTLTQDGDAEGCLTFDPTDKAQVKVALTVIKAKIKRTMTPEQLAALALRFARRPVEGHLSA